MKITKLIKTNNIPWDILPRTRYVIFNLKYVQYNIATKYETKVYNRKDSRKIFDIKQVIPDYRLKRKKNMYLSLFEKTYSEVSVLAIIYLLRLNLEINYDSIRGAYYSVILDFKNNEYLKKFEKSLISFYYTNKATIIQLYLAKMSKENPNLLNAAYFLHILTGERRMYDMEGYFMVELLTNPFDKKLSKIDEKNE